MIPFLLSTYLIQIPVFLVWLVGLAIAVIRWRRHPRVSLLVTSGLLLFFLRALTVPLFRLWIQQRAAETFQVGIQFSALNLGSALVGALAWVLILAAVFSQRRQVESSGD
ncbi:MAG: hypothetical protein P8074_22750 [Anaerolineales bacterium]|jgi:hypothetical protein